MILFDTTNASGWGHGSGLSRVSRRLLAGLGDQATPVLWGKLPPLGPADWFVTPELFSEEERPGLGALLEARPCHLGALYHDAIPIKHPEITWPASVRRHPRYMELLSRFERVWAVSAASRDELLGFWKWQRLGRTPPVDVLALGADGLSAERLPPPPASGIPRVVCVGIVEPRKNQAVLLDAFEALDEAGVRFELHFAGRVNPHFGKPIAHRMAELGRRTGRVFHHAAPDDAALAALVRSARVTAFPSLAEGCGLPLLESLWLGVPCLCSDIAAVLENAAAGGCEVVVGNSVRGWTEALRRVLADPSLVSRLALEAGRRPLPTWAQAARTLGAALSESA